MKKDEGLVKKEFLKAKESNKKYYPIAKKVNHIDLQKIKKLPIFIHGQNKGGLIIIDNVLWHGEVADDKNNDKFTVNIKKFNKFVSEDERVEQIIIPLGDGMTVCRVL